MDKLKSHSFKQSEATIAAVRMFLKVTSLREIGLSNCRLHLPTVASENIFAKAYECSSLVVLRLAGTQVCDGRNWKNDKHSNKPAKFLLFSYRFP